MQEPPVGGRWDNDNVYEQAKGPSQEWTEKLYSSIEQWWGEELTASLAEKASSAPEEQIEAFLEDLAAVYNESPPLPERQLGILRPLVGMSMFNQRDSLLKSSVALRLLLYVPEVAIEKDPIDILFWMRGKPLKPPLLDIMRQTLGRLADLRPFVYQGIVHFTQVGSPTRQHVREGWGPEVLDNAAVRELARRVATAEPGASDMHLRDVNFLPAILSSYFHSQKIGLMRMAENTANPLSRSEMERQLLSVLLSGKIADDRYSTASTLAQLSVPDFGGDPRFLVQLRNSDDKFNSWRQKLRGALSHVGELPDSADLGEASAIVRTELQSALIDIERSTNQSPVLQTARKGVVQFGVSAVGAVSAGYFTGSPLAGLVGGASTQFANSLLQYLKDLRARRSDRLLLALAASFDDDA